MSVEASRYAVSSALWRAGLCGHAERVDIPDHFSFDLADHGSNAGLHFSVERARLVTAAKRLPVHQSSASSFLLRAVSRSRLVRRRFRFCAGTERTLALALVALPPTLLLPAGDVLRYCQVSQHCDTRRRGGMGQARAESDRRGAAVAVSPLKALRARTCPPTLWLECPNFEGFPTVGISPCYRPSSSSKKNG